jgi:hypothetical protein
MMRQRSSRTRRMVMSGGSARPSVPSVLQFPQRNTPAICGLSFNRMRSARTSLRSSASSSASTIRRQSRGATTTTVTCPLWSTVN